MLFQSQPFIVLVSALLPFFADRVLAATPVSGITDFGDGYEALTSGPANGAGLVVEDVFGWNFNLVTESTEAVGLFVEDLAWETGSGLDYYPFDSGVTSLGFLAGSSNGGEYFDLQGFNISLSAMDLVTPSITVMVKGYRDNLEVATYSQVVTLSGGSSAQFDWVDVDSVAGFTEIDEFRVLPAVGSQIGYLGIDNLTAVNFVPEPSSILLAGAFGVFSIVRRRR